ncbi:MAG: hypothetical protein V4472_05295 [Pseudomonadota bacterium]
MRDTLILAARLLLAAVRQLIGKVLARNACCRPGVAGCAWREAVARCG